MRTTTAIATLLATFALFTSACSSAVEPEPTASAAQRVTACGFPEVDTAICDRSEALGTCTELRTEGMDLDEAQEVCESSDGVFVAGSRCARDGSLLGVCPVEEKPGELRLHYYYAGEIFADEQIPGMACAALSEGAWCDAH